MTDAVEILKRYPSEGSTVELVAFHLPQFHPIPENDAWWGAGFSEWRNVASAKPIYPGHNQPLIPGDLGFYDLRLVDTHAAQMELAKAAGISAFCYYHYWFAGRKLLEKPIEIVRENRHLDFKYCLCWANHSWTGHWAGRSDDVLMEQTYPGEEDDRAHYLYLRSFFTDPRYLRREGKPIFLIFRPDDIPQVEDLCERLNRYARQDGEDGVYLIAQSSDRSFLDRGFDAIAPHTLNDALLSYLKGTNKAVQWIKHKLLRYPRWTVRYEALSEQFRNRVMDGITEIPTVVPNWDNTPRVGRRGLVLTHSTPAKFYDHLVESTEGIRKNNDDRKKLLFIKSWNEWAEGNYLEPDLEWGQEWLKVVRHFRDDLDQGS